MRKLLLLIFPFLFIGTVANAQELNATVTINSTKVDASKQALQTLENDLRVFINDRNWTNNQFSANEKIDCGFTIIINELVSPTSFKGELIVQSRRPVFNSTYISPMLNYRDTKLSFDYTEYQPLDFDLNRIDNNLTSVIAYYVYLIFGLDFDSMSPLGGNPFFQSMLTIATNAQSIYQSEWGTFNSAGSRSSIASAFNNPLYDDYRMMWYKYHRLGFDEMASKIDAGRKNIVTSLSDLSSLKSSQPNSILLTLFGDAKLDELIDVYSNGDVGERQSAFETLLNIYPAKSRQLERMRK